MDLSKFIFEPTVTLIAANTIIPHKLEDAIAAQGLTEISEDETTPLNEIVVAAWEQTPSSHGDILPEYGGRFCYRSWKKGRPAKDYIENVMEMQHGSVLEHSTMTFQTIGVSRSFSHELVRHRAGTAYSQESQRYVNAKDMKFVVPPLLAYAAGEQPLENRAFHLFATQCLSALAAYTEEQALLKEELAFLDPEDLKGKTLITKRINEAARSLLPNAAETRMLVTMNLRTLRHVALLRGAEGADLEIRRWAAGVVGEAYEYAPYALADIVANDEQFGVSILGGKFGAP